MDSIHNFHQASISFIEYLSKNLDIKLGFTPGSGTSSSITSFSSSRALGFNSSLTINEYSSQIEIVTILSETANSLVFILFFKSPFLSSSSLENQSSLYSHSLIFTLSQLIE